MHAISYLFICRGHSLQLPTYCAEHRNRHMVGMHHHWHIWGLLMDPPPHTPRLCPLMFCKFKPTAPNPNNYTLCRMNPCCRTNTCSSSVVNRGPLTVSSVLPPPNKKKQSVPATELVIVLIRSEWSKHQSWRV